MKVIILAGGLGTRLGNITESIPKPMVKIGGRPIIWHIMKRYSSFGYKNFVISLGYKAEVIKDYFYNYSILEKDFTIDYKNGKTEIHSIHNENDWTVTLIDTGLNTLKGARIKRVEKYLDDVNMVTYGDGVADIDIEKLIDFHNSHNKILTITGVHPSSRFGELNENNNQVISFIEKPENSHHYINGGYMVFNKELLGYLTENKNCDLENGVMEKLAQMGEVMVYKHEGSWECMDHERDVLHLNNLWTSNNAFWKIW
jgi:glucose-1-phosphate cytidylyltransferase